jgi:hypothetical protein
VIVAPAPFVVRLRDGIFIQEDTACGAAAAVVMCGAEALPISPPRPLVAVYIHLKHRHVADDVEEVVDLVCRCVCVCLCVCVRGCVCVSQAPTCLG